MHYIFPAENMAMELQTAINSYLKKNEWFAQCTREKMQENELRAYKQYVLRLSTSIETLKELISRIGKRVHAKTFSRFQPDEQQKAYQAVCRVWDELQSWQPVTVNHLAGNVPIDRLRRYSLAATQVVSATIQQLRLSPKTCRQLSIVSLTPPSEHGFDLDACVEIVTAVVLDQVGAKMAWASKSLATDANLQKVLADTCNLHVTELQKSDFLKTVIEPLNDSIEEWIKTSIPEPTWRVWSIRTLGRDLCLEQGEDFRVLDWERRMASGEWTLPDVVTLVGQCGPAEKEEDLTEVIRSDLKKQFANTDPRWLYSLLCRQPTRPIPGSGVPKRARESNVVVDPLPQYSYFLNQIVAEPDVAMAEYAIADLALKDLIQLRPFG